MSTLRVIRIDVTAMRKSAVALDEGLLQSAREAVGLRPRNEAIEAGLKALVRQKNREALRRELGIFDIDLTPDELKGLKAAACAIRNRATNLDQHLTRSVGMYILAV